MEPDDIGILCRSIAYLALFLDQSNDQVVDPDAAVQQLESLAGDLQGLTPIGRARFIEVCRSEAARSASDPTLRKYHDFFTTLADDLGLGE